MDHIAIMKKEWGLTQKIINGEKTVESRWYKSKIAPWNRIKPGDILYFKDSGLPVTVKATVTKVDQNEIRNNKHALEIISKYAFEDLGTQEINQDIIKYITNKKYAVFVHFDRVEKVKPFDIDKTGFGMQCAWISVDSVEGIKTKGL